MAQLKSTIVQGNLTASGQITANKFVKIGGLSTQFLMADGSTVNTDTYVTSSNYNTHVNNQTATNSSVDGRLDALESSIGGSTGGNGSDGLTARVTTLEGEMDDVQGDINDINGSISSLSSSITDGLTNLGADVDGKLVLKVSKGGDTMSGTLIMKTDAANKEVTVKTPSISLTAANNNDTVKAEYKYNSLNDCVELTFKP